MFSYFTHPKTTLVEHQNDLASTATSKKTEMNICMGNKTVKRGKDIQGYISLGDSNYNYCSLKIRGDVNQHTVKSRKDQLFMITQGLSSDPENYETLCEMSYDKEINGDDMRELFYTDKNKDVYSEYSHRIPQYMKFYIFSILKRSLSECSKSKELEEFSKSVIIKAWKQLVASDYDVCTCRACVGFDIRDAASYQLGIESENFEAIADEWRNFPESKPEMSNMTSDHNYTYTEPEHDIGDYSYSVDSNVIEGELNSDINEIMKRLDELGPSLPEQPPKPIPEEKEPVIDIPMEPPVSKKTKYDDPHFMLRNEFHCLDYEERCDGMYVDLGVREEKDFLELSVYPFGNRMDCEGIMDIYSVSTDTPFAESFTLIDGSDTEYECLMNVLFFEKDNALVCYMTPGILKRGGSEIHYQDIKFPVRIKGFVQSA